jgi:hypothetical protein
MAKVSVLKENLIRQSDLVGNEVLRDVHSYPGHALRTRDALAVVKEYWDNFTVDYNANNLPTRVCYYVGITPHNTSIGVKADVAGSLNEKYFFIYSARDNTRFHVWYNVDGLGTDPAPGNSIGIEVPIVANDSAAIVAEATLLMLSTEQNREYFKVVRKSAVLEITTTKLGEASDTMDVDTTFIISNTSGSKELVSKVDLTYIGSNPVWEGQELKDYCLNTFTGKFEKNPTMSVDFTPVTSNTPEIFEVSMPVAGTEYNLTLPAGTNRFSLNIRDHLSKYTIGYTSGGTYRTKNRGTTHDVDTLELTSVTIYFTASKPNVTMEIETWR